KEAKSEGGLPALFMEWTKSAGETSWEALYTQRSVQIATGCAFIWCGISFYDWLLYKQHCRQCRTEQKKPVQYARFRANLRGKRKLLQYVEGASIAVGIASTLYTLYPHARTYNPQPD
ncbi:hypothetical protein HOD08_01850, partial [bacterium]|nr:hypothetical protein [bacterium]